MGFYYIFVFHFVAYFQYKTFLFWLSRNFLSWLLVRYICGLLLNENFFIFPNCSLTKEGKLCCTKPGCRGNSHWGREFTVWKLLDNGHWRQYKVDKLKVGNLIKTNELEKEEQTAKNQECGWKSFMIKKSAG